MRVSDSDAHVELPDDIPCSDRSGAGAVEDWAALAVEDWGGFAALSMVPLRCLEALVGNERLP